MVLKGTNQEFGRPYNRRILLEAVRLYGPATRAELAKRVGLTLQTVSNIVGELETQGFVNSSRNRPMGVGARAPSIAINPEGGFAVGVHVTPLGLDAALMNLAGEIVAREQVDTVQIAPDVAFGLIGDLVRKLSTARPGARMLGVGVAVPGPFDIEAMSFVGSTTLEGWKGVRILDRLSEAVPFPAFLEVDTAAAAHAERLYGLGATFRDFYYLFFGVGLGGCFVHDGSTARGARGNAGEVGHIPVVANGQPCPCGNRGCLERYLSLDAYERRAAGTSLDQWIEEVAPVLRSAVVTLENLFDPETIIVGGVAPEAMMTRLVDAAADLPNSVAARSDRAVPRVILSATGDVVVRGAAALAISGVLSPRFGQMFRPDEARVETDPMMRRIEPLETA
jgi:predicted NBD/HSP70 family sugar kinase